jgi:hypothetical protein
LIRADVPIPFRRSSGHVPGTGRDRVGQTQIRPSRNSGELLWGFWWDFMLSISILQMLVIVTITIQKENVLPKRRI